MITFIRTASIAAMLVAGLTAAHAQAPAGPNRPATVPEGHVITPFGYFHPSCVVKLAEGDELRPDNKLVRHANGGTEKMHECAYPHFRADGQKVVGDERHVNAPDISHAWVEYASTTTTTSYARLFAQWTVPPTPTSQDGQTLYFFPGLEDINNVVTILQPVLGWNSDYANAWGIASWNCCVNGTTYEAPPQHVSPGDTVLGYIYDTCAKGTLSCSSWNVVTYDLQNGKQSKLMNTSSFKQTFNWAFGGAVEVYNIKQCSDYPSNGNYWGGHAISFNEIGLYDYNLTHISPSWSVTVTQGLTPQCSYSGSKPAQIVLSY
jgi:hypothetical protein